MIHHNHVQCYPPIQVSMEITQFLCSLVQCHSYRIRDTLETAKYYLNVQQRFMIVFDHNYFNLHFSLM